MALPRQPDSDPALISAAVEAYAARSTTPQPALLDELAAQTKATLTNPQMLSGPVEGRLLELLVHATQARRVLEIGTYSGYSALAMASALPGDGEIITLEYDPSHAEFARRAFASSPNGDKITLLEGPAMDTLPSLQGPFELIFIDADKLGYPDYVDATLPLLADHGLLALDNTLLRGTVLEPADERSETMAALNARLASDPALACVLLTIRDGVTLVRKRAKAP